MEEIPTSSHSALTAIESVDLPEGSSFDTHCAPMTHFDKVIGTLEDIIVGPEFQGLQNYYLSKYWASFGPKDESETGQNTYEDFQIFKDYSQEMSTFLELKLKIIIPSFNIEDFIRQELCPRIESAKQSEADGSGDCGEIIDNEVFEMLFTLVDFLKFKDLLVDYGKMMEGKTPNLTVGQTRLTNEPDDD